MNDKAKALMTEAANTIIAAITEGIANPDGWVAPWHRINLNPVNAVTGKHYTGGNRLVLALHTLDSGALPYWATYKQWESIGAQVRKGEKSVAILRPASRKVDNDDGTTTVKVFGFRAHPVFHAGQVDGFEVPVDDTPSVDHATVAEAFAWGLTTGADIVEHDAAGASYSPLADRITMPARHRWTSVDGAWSTLAHELAHWTGHESRLARKFGTFGSDGYAFEELVAELSAAFTMAALGRQSEPRPDHAQYLAHWLKVLGDDPELLWKAAAAAEKAAGFVLAAAGDRELAAV